MVDEHHPLDVDIAALVDGVLGSDASDKLNAHLQACLLCRIKRQRLEGQPRVDLTSLVDVEVPAFQTIETQAVDGQDAEPGELWVTEGPDGVVVLVRSVDEGDVAVVPVTVDVEVADDECRIVPSRLSPLDIAVVIYDRLRVSIPSSALDRRVVPVRHVDLLEVSEHLGAYSGPPIEDPADPRLEVRQYLADRLTVLGGHQPEPQDRAMGFPAMPIEQALELTDALRQLRALACVEPFTNMRISDSHERQWEGIARVDELGVIVLAIDTPSGLNDQSEFIAAHRLLARCGGSALAVGASSISEFCDVFDAPGLFGAIQVPAGERSHWSLISEMPMADAIAKYLDMKIRVPYGTGTTFRGSHLKVEELLSRHVLAAAKLTVASGTRARIEPKKIGYRSVSESVEELTELLLNATKGSISADEVADIAMETKN